MRVIDCEQGTEEWLQARCKRVTGSRISDVGATTKAGTEAATRRDYRWELICEMLTGVPTPQGFVSADMKWGTEHEDEARHAFMAEEGVTVDKIGFVIHPTRDGAGASPDGIVGMEDLKIQILSSVPPEKREEILAGWAAGIWPDPEAIVEIKCPKTSTHIGYIKKGVAPADYMDQMQWEMRCTGAKWCWFVSYDPRLPDYLQLFIVKVPRNDALIATLERELDAFFADLDREMSELPTPPSEVLVLPVEDQVIFADALLNPPEPADALKAAFALRNPA
jgi:putative phage-type endonuclease